MMLGETILFAAARALYRTEVCQSAEMKSASRDIAAYARYRGSRAGEILTFARTAGVEIAGRRLLDLGCGDGALTREYARRGAVQVTGVDIDERALARARAVGGPHVDYREGSTDRIPMPDGSVDVIVCYDVFEHLTQPSAILGEARRVLVPGGSMLIGTWGWYHPFAPHLFATMPVPWAHVFFSERTVMRVSRRVYHASWYTPTMYDLNAEGRPRPERFASDSISCDYVNKLLVRDIERSFRASGMSYRLYPRPFGSPLAFWTRPLLRVPFAREFLIGYLWAVLTR